MSELMMDEEGITIGVCERCGAEKVIHTEGEDMCPECGFIMEVGPEK